MLVLFYSVEHVILLNRIIMKSNKNVIGVDAVNKALEILNCFTEKNESLSITKICLLYTSPSPRDVEESRMPSSA